MRCHPSTPHRRGHSPQRARPAIHAVDATVGWPRAARPLCRAHARPRPATSPRCPGGRGCRRPRRPRRCRDCVGPPSRRASASGILLSTICLSERVRPCRSPAPRRSKVSAIGASSFALNSSATMRPTGTMVLQSQRLYDSRWPAASVPAAIKSGGIPHADATAWPTSERSARNDSGGLAPILTMPQSFRGSLARSPFHPPAIMVGTRASPPFASLMVCRSFAVSSPALGDGISCAMGKAASWPKREAGRGRGRVEIGLVEAQPWGVRRSRAECERPPSTWCLRCELQTTERSFFDVRPSPHRPFHAEGRGIGSQ